MKSASIHIISFAISTLLMCSSCEKAEILPTDHTTSDDKTESEEPDTIHRGSGERDGTLEYPFNVYDITHGSLGLYLTTVGAELQDCWVEGYIVGYVEGMTADHVVFGTGEVESNIVLAGSPDELDARNTIPVQLAKGSKYVKVRNALNLHANPQMLHQWVVVFGNITPYMNTLGIKNTSKHYPDTDDDDDDFDVIHTDY